MTLCGSEGALDLDDRNCQVFKMAWILNSKKIHDEIGSSGLVFLLWVPQLRPQLTNAEKWLQPENDKM